MNRTCCTVVGLSVTCRSNAGTHFTTRPVMMPMAPKEHSAAAKISGFFLLEATISSPSFVRWGASLWGTHQLTIALHELKFQDRSGNHAVTDSSSFATISSWSNLKI